MQTLTLKTAQSDIQLEAPAIMGILNLTPDSFFDGGQYPSDAAYLNQAEKMLEEGASIIDVGGVSSRPGADEVGEDEELRRIIKPLEQLAKNFPKALISVDTYRSKVAERAVAAGAHIINDISGGTFDPAMAQTIASLQVPYILMHIKGKPQNMQQNPAYENVVSEVTDFFKRQLLLFRNAGVVSSIILDPGFGFGKTVDHNYQLLAHLRDFQQLDCPVLVGLSRKSMINRVLHSTPEDALNGTTVLNTLALMNGAHILRVHDVQEARELVLLFEKYKAESTPKS